MMRAISHAVLAALLLFAALWALDAGRLAVAALDAVMAILNGACAFGFYMSTRRP
jgi:hypothetical protein